MTKEKPKKPTVEEWLKILQEAMLTDAELQQLEIKPRACEEASFLRQKDINVK